MTSINNEANNVNKVTVDFEEIYLTAILSLNELIHLTVFNLESVVTILLVCTINRR